MLTRIMILRMMPVIKTMQPTTALAIARCDTNKKFFTAIPLEPCGNAVSTVV